MVKLKKREARLGLLLVFFWAFSYFWNHYYKPNQSRIHTLQNALALNQIAIHDIQKENPQISQKVQTIKNSEVYISQQKKLYQELIKSIPSQSLGDQFVNHLGEVSARQQVSIMQIKPVDGRLSKEGHVGEKEVQNEKNRDYEFQSFELKLRGEFVNLVKCLEYLDSLSSFSAVEQVNFFKEVIEDKDTGRHKDIGKHKATGTKEPSERVLVMVVRIKFLVTKDATSKAKVLLSPTEFMSSIKLAQNPFLEIRNEMVEAEIEDTAPQVPQMDVKGIVSAGGQFRVIILDKIYREGEMVGETLIQKIEKGRIIFKTGDLIHEYHVK